MNKATYGQIDKALRSLGFSVRAQTLQSKAMVYEHEETGALILLPAFPKTKKVLPHHMAAVRGTLDAFGILDSADFAAELQRAS